MEKQIEEEFTDLSWNETYGPLKRAFTNPRTSPKLRERRATLLGNQKAIGDSLLICNKGMRASLDKNETIVISFPMYKYNKAYKRQERNLLMTNKFLYNLSGFGVITNTLSFFSSSFPIKRKIALTKIKAITYSTISSEFVVHIPDEFDLRYSCECRDEVLRALLDALKALGVLSLPFYFKEEVELADYTTHNSEKKRGLIRPPRGIWEEMTLENFEKFWEKESKARAQAKENTDVLFARRSTRSNSSLKPIFVSLEDFELLKVIGRGGFGKVYLAEMKRTKKLYAIKSIKKSVIIEKEQVDSIKREREILQIAKHPNVVGLEFAFQTPERIFFVMKFIQGGELFVLLRREKKFDEKRAKFYVAQITMALDYLHSNGVIYRDLKPENILLDEAGYLKITDFGASKIIGQADPGTSRSFIGTADYVAPEILARKGQGKEVDWWSLGILTFEMMVGIPPFYNKNQSTMFKWIMNEDPIFPTHCTISDEGKNFIRCLLRKKPKERLGSHGGGKDIQNHEWMRDIDFDKLLRSEIPSPYKPNISSDLSCENFCDQFTREAARNTEITGKDLEKIKKYFI